MAVVIATSTGARSSVPVAAGSVSLTSTVTVGVLVPDPPDALEDGAVATLLTEETTPGVVALFGRVMMTLSPTWT